MFQPVNEAHALMQNSNDSWSVMLRFNKENKVTVASCHLYIWKGFRKSAPRCSAVGNFFKTLIKKCSVLLRLPLAPRLKRIAGNLLKVRLSGGSEMI